VQQLTQIERRQTRLRRIRQKATPRMEKEHVPQDPVAHHHIGTSENFPQRFGQFLQSHYGDPAVTVSLPQLI
jgi:hypothetical protein